jgi:hypothetical protein
LLLIQDLDENTTTVGSLIAAKSKKYREIETHLRAVLPLGPPVHIKELAQRLMGCGLSRTRAYKWLSDFIDDGILLRDAQDQCRINPSTVLV